MKIIILALLFLAGCADIPVKQETQTDVQDRGGCIYVQVSMTQGQDTVKANYWIINYADTDDFRTLYNKNGILITIYIPSITAWREDNYCEK